MPCFGAILSNGKFLNPNVCIDGNGAIVLYGGGREAMVKLIALVRKRDGMESEAFRRYWLDVHAPLASAIPGMRGYRINVAADPGGMAPAPYDGSAEIWFDSRAAMESGLASPQGVIAGDDTVHFAASIEFLVTDETVILPRLSA
jgi:uncharacterized protein (TIGR02118 family)